MPHDPSIDAPPVSRKEVAERRLREMVERLEPGTRLPTFTALRQEIGVSVTTMSRAIEALTARGLLHTRRGSGIYVAAPERVLSVALICDPVHVRGKDVSPFWQMLVSLVRQRASEGAFRLTVHFGQPPEMVRPGDEHRLDSALAEEVRSGRYSGVLAVGLPVSTVHWIQRQGVPVVGFACAGDTWVGLDAQAMARMAVERLAEQGCRRIGLWVAFRPERVGYEDGQPVDPFALRAAVLPFREALAANGLPYLPELVRDSRHTQGGDFAPLTPESNQMQGQRFAWETFGPESDPALRPDGLYAADDNMMQGALPTLARLGALDGSVRIVSHANAGSSLLFGYEDVLGRVEVDPERIAEEMIAALEKRVLGRHAPGRILLPVTWQPPRLLPDQRRVTLQESGLPPA